MKSIDSILIAKETIESLYEELTKVPYSNIEALRPVLALRYSSAIDELRVLFNGSSTKEEKEDDEDDADDVVHEAKEVKDIIEKADDKINVAKGVTLSTDTPWLKYKHDVVWRHDKGTIDLRFNENGGYMISADGDVWDVEGGQIVEPFWLDGDLRITIPADRYVNEKESHTVRVATMVCRAFKVYSNTKGQSQAMIINFKDNDRRNLQYTNIEWIPFQPSSAQKQTVHDICQRLCDFDGDVEKTMSMYKNCPVVTTKIVTDIRFKMTELLISNQYFMLDSKGNFVKGKKTSSNLTELNKNGELLRITEKIKNKYALTKDEKIGLVTATITDILNRKKGKNKVTAEIVVDEIRDAYGIMISTEIAESVIGGMKK